MSLPGFTGDASLYRTRRHYRSMGNLIQADLSAHSALRTLQPQSWKFDNCRLYWDGYTGKTERQCSTDWKWRTVSTLSECPGAEKNGALCYPFCAEGYHGAGPFCWQDCPAGYTDDGATCRRDAHIISADNSQCPWYDKCGLTFARGCSKCPPGYANDGCTCRIDVDIFLKNSYARGVGSPMSCRQDEQQIGALCYGSCPEGYVASGVTCTATTQTCKDVPITIPPDYSHWQRFCFARRNPHSQVDPCTPVFTSADSEEHARQVLQCECTNCTYEKVDCSVLDAGRACG